MNIAILGAGQLGRMLALAGTPLGHRFRLLDPAADSPAGHCGELVVGAYDDPAAWDRLLPGVEVVTYEFENVAVAAAEALAARVPVHPSPPSLRASQDRVEEKEFLNRHGIATAPFAAVATRADLEAAVARLALPAVLKTRRLGYDGKGQALLRTTTDVDAAWTKLGGQPLILEGFVPFQSECSLISVRGRDGAMAFYPLAENQHAGGILRLSIAPHRTAGEALQREAEGHARRIMDALGYVGVLTIEFFVAGGRLIANEMAPRVHNSGHWTIEGADCSQFENHIRAIAGQPLGSTRLCGGAAAMVNLIGAFPDLDACLALPGLHVHHYGKAPRDGRKIGHLTLVAEDHARLAARLSELRARIGLPLER